MDRAGELNRVLFSQDADFLIEAAKRQREGRNFFGVVYSSQLARSIGQVIEDLQLVAQAGEMGEFANRVTYLPLR